jgi:hypothetical protein
MISEKQHQANIANAQKSTGPITDEGKRRSSLNAIRHGLTGHVVVMPEEDIEAYKAFTAAIVSSFSPQDANESQLAQSYASFQWRINRAASVEDTLYTVGIMEGLADNLNIDQPEAHNATAYAKAYRSDCREFDRLSLYSQRLVHQSQKVLQQLKECQAERRRREQAEMCEAVALYEAHCEADAIFDPQENGFVLTLPQIMVATRRQNLLHPGFIAEEIRNGRVKAA